MNLRRRQYDYRNITKRRTKINFTKEEISLIAIIKKESVTANRDNLTRTAWYADYFNTHPEIKWSFLASMVSRNAGWNMTDLEGNRFSRALPKGYRCLLFNTYERANWLIFSDASPQLLVFKYSKLYNKPLFHLLKAFNVSVFMEAEWERFWIKGDKERLMAALIINEQNFIQEPVIEHPVYGSRVFGSLVFHIQEWLHFTYVLFPTLKGELFGFSVHNFTSLPERIELGKKLAWILFHPEYFRHFLEFSKETPHTGSRHDYEKHMAGSGVSANPELRDAYPVIVHRANSCTDWFERRRGNLKRYFSPCRTPKKVVLTDWYKKKARQLELGIDLEEVLVPKGLFR